MYSIKNNISQIVPAGVYHTTTDDFTCYADNFDLSLLSNDGEVPLSPQSQLTIQTNYQNQFNNSNQTNLFTSDYIPATIFNDSPSPQSYNDEYNQQMLTPVSSPQYQSMKTEKQDWLKYSMNEISQHLSKQTNQDNEFLNQLAINYNYQYPSPLPSPPQQQENKFIPNYYPLSPPNSTCSSSAGSSPSQHTTAHDYNCNFTIKQEFGVSLPPSPADSNSVPSPLCCEIKTEPDHQDEVCIDIESLLNDSFEPAHHQPKEHHQHHHQHQHQHHHQPQDHQLLREYLQDTTFQRKHNLKPVALESLIGGWSTRGDIEPVFSLALAQIKRDVQDTCALLDIPPDPQLWTSNQVQSWLKSQISTWNLKEISNIEVTFPENGADMSQLSEDEFISRVPESGATLYAQLVVWKGACSEVGTSIIPVSTTANSSPMMSPLPNIPLIPTDEWNNITVPQANNTKSSSNTMTDLSDEDDEEMPLDLNSPPTATLQATPPSPSTNVASTTNTTTPTSAPRTGRQGGSHIHLWQFLKELLASPQTHGTAIRWLDRTKGVFKIEDSVRVARLWGRRKNRPAMNYDKLSRSIRQYYKKGIMKKTERSQRLVYQFCHPYCL